MNKEDLLLKASDLLKSNYDKGRSYIKGALQVKSDGKLSDELRKLLSYKA
jgi:hypothetical protein